jgi:hypothetical protein
MSCFHSRRAACQIATFLQLDCNPCRHNDHISPLAQGKQGANLADITFLRPAHRPSDGRMGLYAAYSLHYLPFINAIKEQNWKEIVLI